MGKGSHVVKGSTAVGGTNTPVKDFVKWLAGMVAEKLIAREAAKKPSKKRSDLKQ